MFKNYICFIIEAYHNRIFLNNISSLKHTGIIFVSSLKHTGIIFVSLKHTGIIFVSSL
jgi:hypothetical protein